MILATTDRIRARILAPQTSNDPEIITDTQIAALCS
jgi:hypothetical protein